MFAYASNLKLHQQGCVYSDVLPLRILSVAILLPEAHSVVLADMQHLMRLPCLATVVDMSFQEGLLTLNMVNGKN